MSIQDPRGPAEFEPVKLGPRRRRIDPVAVGVVIVLAALVLAVVKPWGDGDPGIFIGPSAAAPSSSTAPTIISTRGALVPPTWADVRSVVSRHDAWGIRTIVLGSTTSEAPASPRTSERYAERWAPTDFDGGKDVTTILAGGDGAIVALGITFPPAETPLDVRIWLDYAGGELEWMDARPVSDVPARGAYLFLRQSVAGAAVRSWAPGRYRMDVLVNGGIRRIDVEIPDPSGRLPDPPVWTEQAPQISGLKASEMVGLPSGSFAWVDGSAVPLASTDGPANDETGAWLDVDPVATDQEPRSFVARTYQPHATWLGVVLSPSSTVRSSALRRLAPFDDATDVVGETTTGSGTTSFVAFAPLGRATWHPGVYALSVSWVDGDRAHDGTWHIELRPGPLPAEPVLLVAVRAWARYAGSSGVLLGTTEPLDGEPAAGIRLLEIATQTRILDPGLNGSDLIGCGETAIHGQPTLIGIVGPAGADLTPVTARILYPFSDTGPLLVLTAAGSVPGLTLISPVVTAEFGGPASYGFRAGSSGDALGYTICIGLAPGG